MIFLHERMQSEAKKLKELIADVFKLPVCVVEDNLDRFFYPIPKFGGYSCRPRSDVLEKEFPNTAVFILTSRDLYSDGDSKDDDWVFGASIGKFSVVATARLMGIDNIPRTSLAVDEGLYLRRISLMTIHELGHDLIRELVGHDLKKLHHYQIASWVNVRRGYEVRLGEHCDDNHCAMYEVVDITTPSKSEGYLKLGSKYLYDAGLDQHLGRLRSDWFCSRCKNHIVITDEYRKL